MQCYKRFWASLGYAPISDAEADQHIRDRLEHGYKPRVWVAVGRRGDSSFDRRPFRRKGRGWCVRMCGVARLSFPMKRVSESGLESFVFYGDYNT